MKKPIVILAIYLLFIALGIPWYWPADSTLVLLGLPGWVLVAILVSLCASMFTAYLLLSEPWQGEDQLDE